MATKKKSLRTPYYNVYYHTVRKIRNKEGRPVKNCQACGKPIINPKKYKQNVHLSGIQGIRSDCQKKRDSDYKKEQRALGNIRQIKIPEGLYDKYNVQKQRDCLKCHEPFPSQSLHNRICDRCKTQQPDIMNFYSIALETHNINELLEPAYQN
jgi:hypothetical protein